MHKRRLLHLAKVLREAVDPAKLDMSLWHCGTSGCAIGWACHDPKFRKEGLKLASSGPVEDDEGREIGEDYYPRYGYHTNWAAVNSFFNLTDHYSSYLFSSSSYRGEVRPVDVAERILSFIAQEEAREQAAALAGSGDS